MSEYAHGISESWVVFRLRAARGDLEGCTLFIGDRACRENPVRFTPVNMFIVSKDLLFDYWEAEIDTPYKRICYYFLLQGSDEEVYYYADFFHREVVPDRSEFYQLPFVHRADIATVPDWARDAVIYNIFPDSFATGYRHISLVPVEKEWKGETVRGKLGGTIAGITENADYFQQLGVNCIYINPIFAAGEYHKYDILDYYHIDPCFGTNDEFAQMVETLHSRGIKVIIDGVFNHCGWHFFAFEDVVKNGKESPYWDWFYGLTEPVVRPDNQEDIPGYECFAYERLMPKLATDNPAVRDYFLKVCRYWLEKYGIDGWRLDVASEVDDRFWREFRQAALEINPEALIIGEVWESANHWLDGSLFHSSMNYDFRKHCRDFFASRRIDAEEFEGRITNMLMRYRKNVVFAQLNLLDSHDVGRFLSLCQGDKERFKQAVLFQMCFVGIPSIFYGDEQGISGVLEDEYRHEMIWDGDQSIFDFYQKAVWLRREHPALRRGDFKMLYGKGDCISFLRNWADERICVTIWRDGIDRALMGMTCGEVLWEGESFRITGEKGYADD
jgi:glycosidase